MIERLVGEIVEKSVEKAEGHVVLDVAGVGYGLDVPGRVAEAMGAVGERATLWVYTIVREDALSLCGFLHRGEREAFEVFMGISGFGPRAALALLSHFDVERLVQVVMKADAKALTGVPGIGMKKAEKLILELKNRIDRLSAGIEPERLVAIRGGAAAMAAAGGVPMPAGANAADAVAGLEALGTQPAVARLAVARAIETLGAEADAEALVREGLKRRRG